jgi:hypothetical protein
MSIRFRYLSVAVVSLLVLGLAAPADAGRITTATVVSLPGPSTGSLGPLGLTPSLNNDNAGAINPNSIPYSIVYNALGTADYEFQVEASGGTTEYLFSTPGLLPVVNNTGVPWTGYQFELGFGTGANFVKSNSGDALDFDLPSADPLPTSTVFPILDHQTDSIFWSGGSVASIGSVRFLLAVDVPDGLELLNPSGLNRFTLRQTPIVAASVPEPTALVLLTSGIAGVVLARRRRRA